LNRNKILLIAAVVAVVAIGLVFAIRNSSTSTTDVQGTIGARSVQADEHNPFTNVAYIPATVDPKTIRFEKLRMVDLASKTQTTTDAQNCKDQQFRESQSQYCQSVSVVEKVKGIEARYSYAGPVISSGESVPGRDEFSVYFRPEELSSVGSLEKLNREQASSLFDVTTSRPTIQERVIDKAHSQFCAGNYVDGNWTKTDPKCEDQVQYINQTVASPNLLVQVDLHRPGRTTTN